ncbi:Soluble pyridine nucleotide transhydrogenase [Sinobacterium norvegicum]|uniref:Soluble pyridine nucleotide transhydrogenase n=1 Tax=Sinobacterium norvegicum TaxID=1641715 RepID=A0ABN8ELB5_9GAMM|nr:Si-specific NAD(P)(+) transhydrogenase [Sinobacterium norvegicum]CAH0993122.1 Soluble pyridine nucleotide transhydrogenase [Sinobacterium norvegicum]
MSYDFDAIVIGAGPAGESAAINAAKHGRRVAIIEDRPQVGGGCTHKGTIPSKALRSAVKQLVRFNRHPLFHEGVDPNWFDFPKIMKNVQTVIREQVTMRERYYGRNRIKVFHGQASFTDQHSVQVKALDGENLTLTTEDFIIACGSRPYRPDSIDFSHARVYDSDTILEMAHNPKKLIIYGAGVIGCEYASIFSGLGMKVELVNNRERLLEFLDDEISDALSYQLRDHGVMVRHREEFEKLETTDNNITLHLASGKRIVADALLWCNGRSGNTDTLNLDVTGLTADHRGQLKVNQRYQTEIDNIFAIGDVIGWPSLASAAYNQGRSAAAAARGKENSRFVAEVATGIYTLPEISSVGATERELTESKIPYEVGRAFFKDCARAQISGSNVGMLKLLFCPDSLKLLGIHCFGAEATEIVHIGQAIMNQQGEGNSIEYFIKTTFNYPTMAEAYRIAALNGMNRLD